MTPITNFRSYSTASMHRSINTRVMHVQYHALRVQLKRIRPVGFFFHFLSGTKRFTIAGSRKWIKILIPNQLDRVLSKAYFGWVHF